jgi:nucleotide-binding universal stress UspA family protein
MAMKILVPIDGSELALQALQHVIELARAGLAVELVLANVQEPASAYEMLTLQDPEALAEVAVGAGRDLMAPAVALADQSGLPYAQTVVVGDVVPALLELLEEEGCAAVVMGSHGMGLVRSALGSVSRGMLEDAPVPVTFVKAAPEPASDEAQDQAGDDD